VVGDEHGHVERGRADDGARPRRHLPPQPLHQIAGDREALVQALRQERTPVGCLRCRHRQFVGGCRLLPEVLVPLERRSAGAQVGQRRAHRCLDDVPACVDEAVPHVGSKAIAHQ
jgi:hypothetical protein